MADRCGEKTDLSGATFPPNGVGSAVCSSAVPSCGGGIVREYTFFFPTFLENVQGQMQSGLDQRTLECGRQTRRHADIPPWNSLFSSHSGCIFLMFHLVND